MIFPVDYLDVPHVIEIEGCDGCPMHSTGWPCGDSVCGHPNAPDDNLVGRYLGTFPEWCPLKVMSLTIKNVGKLE